jgi:thymidine kinase
VWVRAVERLRNMRDEEDIEDFEDEDEIEAEAEAADGVAPRANTKASTRAVREVYPEPACDVLIVDEAQLYPAETIFVALLLWYRPRKVLLLGMDSKQAGQ